MGAIDGHLREVLAEGGAFDPDECTICRLAAHQGHLMLRDEEWVVREGWAPMFTAEEAR